MNRRGVGDRGAISIVLPSCAKQCIFSPANVRDATALQASGIAITSPDLPTTPIRSVGSTCTFGVRSMDARASYPRQLAYDPFRPPDWRWHAPTGSLPMAATSHGAATTISPPASSTTCALEPHTRGRPHWPPLPRHPRRTSSTKAPPQSSALSKARILAGQTSTEIARLAKIPARVIDTYEAVFFCCRDRLKARDWVACHCLRTSGLGSDEVTSAQVLLKTFAYHGGIHAFDAFAPYLLGDMDINDGSLDLATPQGRWDSSSALISPSNYFPSVP